MENKWPWTSNQLLLSPGWWEDWKGDLPVQPNPSPTAKENKHLSQVFYSPGLKGITYQFTTNRQNKNNCEGNYSLAICHRGHCQASNAQEKEKAFFPDVCQPTIPLLTSLWEVWGRQKTFWLSKAANLPVPTTNPPSSAESSALATLSASTTAEVFACRIAQDHQTRFIAALSPWNTWGCLAGVFCQYLSWPFTNTATTWCCYSRTYSSSQLMECWSARFPVPARVGLTGFGCLLKLIQNAVCSYAVTQFLNNCNSFTSDICLYSPISLPHVFIYVGSHLKVLNRDLVLGKLFSTTTVFLPVLSSF